MTIWILGRDLLTTTYNLTFQEIFNAVQEGSLVPRMSPDAEWIKRNEYLDGPERMWRVFPTPDLQKKWLTEVCAKKANLEQNQRWFSMSDEEIVLNQLTLYESIPRAIPQDFNESDPEGFVRGKLPEIRKNLSQRIREFPLQIRKMEEELAPNRVWKNLDLGDLGLAQQEVLMNKLLDASYSSDQVEAISGAKPQKQSVSATKTQETKSYAAKIKEETRAKAKALWVKDPTITIVDMAYKDELNEVALMKNGSVYSEATIKKWIKDLCPDRKPGRRPKK